MLSLTEDHCRDSRAVPSIDIHRFTQVSSLVIIIIIIITIIIIIIIINIIIVIVVNIILISLVLYHDLIIFGNAEYVMWVGVRSYFVLRAIVSVCLCHPFASMGIVIRIVRPGKHGSCLQRYYYNVDGVES